MAQELKSKTYRIYPEANKSTTKSFKKYYVIGIEEIPAMDSVQRKEFLENT